MIIHATSGRRFWVVQLLAFGRTQLLDRHRGAEQAAARDDREAPKLPTYIVVYVAGYAHHRHRQMKRSISGYLQDILDGSVLGSNQRPWD